MIREDEAAATSLPIPGAAGALLGDLLWEVSAYVELLGEAEPGITVAELSRRTPRTPEAISQIVARLEKLGLVERRVKTGRGIGLHLADEGRSMAEQAFDRESSADEQLLGIVGPKNHQALRAFLLESRKQLRSRH